MTRELSREPVIVCGMEARIAADHREARVATEPRLVAIPGRRDAGEPSVHVEGGRITVERLDLQDPGLAGWLAERPAEERPAVIERALRVGLLALQDAGVTLNVDIVRAEFEKLASRTEQLNEQAAAVLDQALRANFGDEDGRLPRTLERFLGDRGALRKAVEELFDPARRDSAIGRIGTMLDRYFEGDASKLAQLLDPTRLGSPLHQFRTEIAAGFEKVNERLIALEAASRARGEERSKSAAKGGDFEDLLEAMLGDVARGGGDLLDRTSNETGSVIKSKKGDFVLAVNAALTRGADLRIVVEAKDRAVSGPAMRDELREAKTNRGACVGLVVFTPAHAPTGIAPFDVRNGDVYCVIDPEAPEPATLEAAVRLARLLAVATLADREVTVDAAAISAALAGIREQLDQIRQLKSQLTSIGTATKAVWSGLDTLRGGVLERVSAAEAALRIG